MKMRILKKFKGEKLEKNKKSKKLVREFIPTSDKSFDQTFATEGWKSLD